MTDLERAKANPHLETPATPKPKEQIPPNPSAPGIQRPGNKPDGREAPPQDETLRH